MKRGNASLLLILMQYLKRKFSAIFAVLFRRDIRSIWQWFFHNSPLASGKFIRVKVLTMLLCRNGDCQWQ
jgi:hypothetical protein